MHDDDSDDTSSESDMKELNGRFLEIEDVIENLYKLSFKIRNTKYRSLTTKAVSITEIDPDTEQDLFSAYANFDFQHVLESLDHLRIPAKQKVPEISEHSSDDFLINRLAKAITNRRRYFAYWQRHALKLSSITDEQVFEQLIPSLIASVKVGVRELQPTLPAPLSRLLLPGPKPTLSGTEFSKYDRDMDAQVDSESVISYATTAYDVDGKSPELPLPPSDAASKEEFLCPYCWVVCPSRQGRGKSWR
jgi:hypothetical protein